MEETTHWPVARLQGYRGLTDPLADAVVEKIIEGGDLNALRDLFNKLQTNDVLDSVDLPEEVRSYFQQTSELPDWADPDKIATGEAVFASYGPEITMLLMCKSLPESYACAKGSMVLYKTGRLTEQNGSLEVFTRRLMETAQFVINVCSPGGLAPKGNGIITAQKVRLIHASIRYYLKHQGWETEKYGEPINQQDMAGTLQSFSTLIMEGLENMGVKLTEDQKAGYYHCWHVVGHIVGLKPELNMPTHQEGLALGYAILDNQVEESEHGKVLTMALTKFMESSLPGNLFNHVPAAMIRHFCGDEISDKLGVENRNRLLERVAPRLLNLMAHENAHMEHSKYFHALSENFNLALLQGMLFHYNDRKQVHFYIPPGLREDWKLN